MYPGAEKLMLSNNKILFFVLFFITTACSQVNISGTVRDSRTKEPVNGAAVKLMVLNSSAVTDESGTFNISRTSVQQLRSRTGNRIPVVASNNIVYHAETGVPVQIRIIDLSGKEAASIFSGSLSTGLWQITPPKLSPGTYFCSFSTPASNCMVRFLFMEKNGAKQKGNVYKISDRYNSSFARVAEKQADILPVDSLMISKDGYRTAYVAIDSYQQNALEVFLEDTVSPNIDDATIIPDPSWTCFMPDGIPPPKTGVAVFNINLELDKIHDIGETRFGHRRQLDIKGGTINGERISGSVVTGGLDYELTLSNGSIELEQIVILKADNAYILMRNAGVAPANSETVRVVLDFESPNSSSYAWLNTGKFAANRIVDTSAKTIKLEVFDISEAVHPEKTVQIIDPGELPDQTWDCVTLTGTKGGEVFTENVTLGSSIYVGESKRGSRNIIPITGGTTSGRVNGQILSGGADYQLNGLDARYTLAPDDGELIIVRNCGAMGKLIPVFEARKDGPYAFLNENAYISSNPDVGSGGVRITFYEYR